jgi:hypothetical protein
VAVEGKKTGVVHSRNQASGQSCIVNHSLQSDGRGKTKVYLKQHAQITMIKEKAYRHQCSQSEAQSGGERNPANAATGKAGACGVLKCDFFEDFGDTRMPSE